MTSIQDFYKQILTALRYRVDEDDLISFLPPEGGATPATVEKRRLVLPTKERLREGIDDALQPFHPLSESIARKGASPVLSHMQRTAKAVLAYYTTEIAAHLLAVAADPKLHKDLPPNTSDYLKKLPNADKKSLEDFYAIVERASSKNKLITLYLKHGGKLDGDKYNRLCVVHFPIMDLFNTEDEAVLGVKLRKKDKKTLQALLHHVMPFGDDPEHYSAGSNSRIAPYFDAFMHAYTKVATQLNTILKRYAKAIDLNLPDLPLDYLDGLADLTQFYEKIPSLRGNEGVLDKAEDEAPAQPVKATGSAVSSAFGRINEPVRSIPALSNDSTPPWESRPEPAARQQPQRATGGGMTMSDFRTSLQPPTPPGYNYQQPQGGYSQQPQQGYPYQQPNYGYGGYQQDPRRPSWLMGQQQPPQVSPFAQVVQPQQPVNSMQSYGPISGVSNYWGNGAPSGRL